MAQGNVIDRFFIALGLDTKDVEKGIQSTVDTVKGGLKELLVGAVMPAVGALASGALVQQFTDEITQVDRLSKSLGVNIEQLQAWQGAAQNAGVQADEIGEIFADLNDWMIDAAVNGSGALNEFIEKGLLPSVTDANGAMKTTEQYAMDLADAFAAMDKQSATGIGRQIGISNAGMVAFLQQGSASISAQMQQIKQLGVYTEQDAKAAQDFAAASRDLFRALKMMLLPVYRILAPILTIFAEIMQEMTKHTAAFIPVLVGIGALLATMVYPWLVKTAAAAAAFIASPWGILITALAAIGLLLDDFVTWLDGGKSAFGEFYESVFGNAENVKAAINDFVDNAKAAFENFKTFVSEVWQDISPALEIFGYLMLDVAKRIWEAVKDIYTAIKFAINVFKEIVEGAENMANRISLAIDNINAAFDDFKTTAISIWTAIEPYVTAFGNMLLSLGSLVWDWAGTIAAAANVVYEVFSGLITGGEDMSNRVSAALDNLQNKFNTVLEDIKSYINSWWEFVSPIINKAADFLDIKLPALSSILPSLPDFGNPALATPGTAGTTNNTTNKETNIDGKFNITIQGNADREAIQQAQEQSGAWFGDVAQANASQYGI